MKNLVSRDFKNLPQADSLIFANNIVQKMTIDAQFIGFKLQIEALELARQGYSDAITAANTKDPVMTILKNNKRKDMDDKLDDAADFVNALAKGDKAIILASGFNFIGDAKPITELLAPTGFKVVNVLNQPGKVKLNWDEVKGTYNYALEMRVKGTETWESCGFPSARSIIIKDLKLGSNVEFRVRALGSRNLIGDWSLIVDVWVS